MDHLVIYQRLFTTGNCRVRVYRYQFKINDGSNTVFFNFASVTVLFRNLPVRVTRDFLPRNNGFFERFVFHRREGAGGWFYGVTDCVTTAKRSLVPTPSAIFALRFFRFNGDKGVTIVRLISVGRHNGAYLLFNFDDDFRCPQELTRRSVLRVLVLLRLTRRNFFHTANDLPAIGCDLGTKLTINGRTYRAVNVPDYDPEGNVVVNERTRYQRHLCDVPDQVPNGFCDRAAIYHYATVAIRGTIW